MTMSKHFVESKYGRIHYAEQGSGEVLLLLHSNGCSHHSFIETMDALAAQYRCIAWDMPSHGDSEQSTQHLSVHDYADAVVSFMDALDIKRAHICGTSIGGMICIAVGALYPDRVSSLVIAEAPLRSRDMWAKGWPIIEAMFSFPQQSAEDIATRVRDATPALVQRWNIDRLKAGSWRMIDVMWALRDFDAVEYLKRVQRPCSVIIGSSGPVAASQADYQTLLPKAPILVLDNVGHFPMLDDPARLAATVLEGIRLAQIQQCAGAGQ